jgi:hypothetical protein
MVKDSPFVVASMRRPVRSCRVFWLVDWQVWVVGQLNAESNRSYRKVR